MPLILAIIAIALAVVSMGICLASVYWTFKGMQYSRDEFEIRSAIKKDYDKELESSNRELKEWREYHDGEGFDKPSSTTL
jgi:nitrogen fixation-related uncharacterized protein